MAYAYELYGVNVSFAIGWAMALIYIATTTFEAVSVGWVAGALLEGFEGRILYTVRGDPVYLGSLALGLGGMALLTYLNYRGAKTATRFQDVLTYGVLGCSVILWVYADSCGLKTAFLGNGGRKAATIFSLRYSSSR